MNFDEIIPRNGTHSMKWDELERRYGLDTNADMLPMWVADMDFRPPKSVQDALDAMLSNGVYGYFGDDRAYRDAICWWMNNRHNWHIEPDWILTTHGLVNGAGMVIDALTEPGDGIAVMTPIYHGFLNVIRAAGRRIVECPLEIDSGRYVLDISSWDQLISARDKILILCSPHNPGGRVWTQDELHQIAEFAERHGLWVISDDIHHDLVYPPHKHLTFANTCPDFANRLITMTSTTKTFNLAAGLTGNLIISDSNLRQRVSSRLNAIGITPNAFGLIMAEAAYSPSGAQWLDALIPYLRNNRRQFDLTINGIPGLISMPLEGTYLSWVSFENTGMTNEEIQARLLKEARIAPSFGASFGRGGESFVRFNLAMPHAQIKLACERLLLAFADLQ